MILFLKAWERTERSSLFATARPSIFRQRFISRCIKTRPAPDTAPRALTEPSTFPCSESLMRGFRRLLRIRQQCLGGYPPLWDQALPRINSAGECMTAGNPRLAARTCLSCRKALVLRAAADPAGSQDAAVYGGLDQQDIVLTQPENPVAIAHLLRKRSRRHNDLWALLIWNSCEPRTLKLGNSQGGDFSN